MQVERVEICAARLMANGVTANWIVPLTSDSTVDDVMATFAQFLVDNSVVSAYPILDSCFKTLVQSTDECMFVFMRKGSDEVLGILRSDKPLCSPRERQLLQQLGHGPQSVLPLWTWRRTHHNLTQSMEYQCRATTGPCFGIWCYR